MLKALTLLPLAKITVADAIESGITKSPKWLADALSIFWPASHGGQSTLVGKRKFLRPYQAGSRPVPAGQEELLESLAAPEWQPLALDLLQRLAEERSKAFTGIALQHGKTIATLPAEMRDPFTALLYWLLDDNARRKVIAAVPELRTLFEEEKRQADTAAEFFKGAER